MSEATGVGKRIHRLRGEKGQAIVELAFVLPILLLFLFGIIDFGIALNTKNSDTNLANVTARSLSVSGTSAPAVCTTASTLLACADAIARSDDEPQPTAACLEDENPVVSPPTYGLGDPIKVELQTPFHWFGIIGASGGASSTFTTAATMRIEQPMVVSGSTTNPFITGGPICSS